MKYTHKTRQGDYFTFEENDINAMMNASFTDIISFIGDFILMFIGSAIALGIFGLIFYVIVWILHSIFC